MSFFEWVQARWWMWKTGNNPASVLFLNNEETDRMERLAKKLGVSPVEIVTQALKLIETVFCG